MPCLGFGGCCKRGTAGSSGRGSTARSLRHRTFELPNSFPYSCSNTCPATSPPAGTRPTSCCTPAGPCLRPPAPSSPRAWPPTARTSRAPPGSRPARCVAVVVDAGASRLRLSRTRRTRQRRAQQSRCCMLPQLCGHCALAKPPLIDSLPPLLPPCAGHAERRHPELVRGAHCQRLQPAAAVRRGGHQRRAHGRRGKLPPHRWVGGCGGLLSSVPPSLCRLRPAWLCGSLGAHLGAAARRSAPPPC